MRIVGLSANMGSRSDCRQTRSQPETLLNRGGGGAGMPRWRSRLEQFVSASRVGCYQRMYRTAEGIGR